MRRILNALIAVTLVTNIYACGTILYPERKGQLDGRLDVGVVVLNSLGLLLYFIPGVIAFAVDFSNGTIYLPGGVSSTLDADELELLADKSASDLQLQAIVNRAGGKTQQDFFQQQTIKIVRLSNAAPAAPFGVIEND